MDRREPLAGVTSIRTRLAVLVGASVVVAALVGALGTDVGVPLWISLPVTIALALVVTRWLATGMTTPLREMTAAASRVAAGDYDVRVTATGSDEVGQLARAFNTMATDLAAVDRQRRELVANVSHELRTPLTGLVARPRRCTEAAPYRRPLRARCPAAAATAPWRSAGSAPTPDGTGCRAPRSRAA